MAQNPGNTPLHKGLPPAAVRLIEDGRNYHVYQQRPPLSPPLRGRRGRGEPGALRGSRV